MAATFDLVLKGGTVVNATVGSVSPFGTTCMRAGSVPSRDM